MTRILLFPDVQRGSCSFVHGDDARRLEVLVPARENVKWQDADIVTGGTLTQQQKFLLLAMPRSFCV